MEYQIKLDRFEGPYTKLLELIEDRKLSITEVSLASIAEEYIAFVQTLEKKDYQDISQFIVVAATLMLIKVKTLIGEQSISNEEEKNIHDLEKRLILFQEAKEASKLILSRFGKTILVSNPARGVREPVFAPAPQVSQSVMLSVAKLMLHLISKKDHLKKIAVETVVRMETIIERMIEKIGSGDLLHHIATGVGVTEKKKALLLTFLGLLELLRLGKVDAMQDETGAIRVSRLS